MLDEEIKAVYTAMPKCLAYFRSQISKYVLEQGCIPLNPFMIFELDAIDNDDVRKADNKLIEKLADEVWVFGETKDDVINAVDIAKQMNKPIRYFKVVDSKKIKEIN